MSSYQYRELPGPLSFYLKAIFGSKPGFKDGDKLTPISASLESFSFDETMVKKYAELCSLNLDGQKVPLLFPHSLFGPL
ncbi:MAG: hypothetical protein HQK54_04365, partial [Oligoflexales bacterium]|nr:hypothetical protein [Oligoflexales bacterium]